MGATGHAVTHLRATARPLNFNPSGRLFTHSTLTLTRSYHVTSYQTRSRHTVHQIPLLHTTPRPGQTPLRVSQHANKLQRLGGEKRHFSVVPLVESVLTSTQHHISAFHSVTGIAWYITIPLLAFSLNLVTRLPITIITNRIARRRVELSPILQAWYGRHAKDVAREQTASSPEAAKKLTEKRFDKTSKRLFKAYGVQRWKDYLNLGILPVWLLNIEALRRLSGGRSGLLGTLMYGNQPDIAKDHVLPGSSTETTPLSPVELSPPTVDLDLTPTTTTQDIITQSISSHADPSLATGGVLWFPDLMVADPLHILPCTLSVLLALNILPTTRTALRAFMGMDTGSSTLVQSQGRLRLQRALVILSLAVGPLTMQLPAAIHLYWVSSTAITMVMKKAVDWVMPIPKAKTVTPCKDRNTVIMLPRREKKDGL